MLCLQTKLSLRLVVLPVPRLYQVGPRNPRLLPIGIPKCRNLLLGRVDKRRGRRELRHQFRDPGPQQRFTAGEPYVLQPVALLEHGDEADDLLIREDFPSRGSVVTRCS